MQINGPEPSPQGELLSRSMWLHAARPLISGLAITTLFVSFLIEVRFPHSPWRIIGPIVLLAGLLAGFRKKDKTSETAELLWIVACLFLAPVYYFRTHEWAPIATGAIFALYFLFLSKFSGRSYPFVSAGCLLAGILSLQVPWPNSQRCILTLVGFGVTMTLQGAWILVRFLQGHAPQSTPNSNEPEASSGEMGLERFLLCIFGSFERIQICSPEFERRIRERYQSETGQLDEIGFDCVFFYGESYPLYRLLLVFPALIFFSMWRNRVPMTLQGGTRILNGNPVFAARDKSAYAHSNDMGITFHTAFENGSVFVSRNFGDDEDKKVPAVSVKVFKGSGAEDLWAKHQLRIQEEKFAGNQIDSQSSFEAYRQMILKEEVAEGRVL
jgi:hypothetical protein